MIKVNIIGTGNVAWHLAKTLSLQKKVVLAQIAGRSIKNLEPFKQFAQETISVDFLQPADVTIIAVSDDAIAQVETAIPFDNALVVHTSGFTEMSALSQKHTKGVFYPLQSFSKGDETIDFKEIPILIEAENDKDEKTLLTLAKLISNNVQVLDSLQRRQLHLAAVFANNFTNHCYTIAQEICKSNNVPFDTLHALISKTAEKALKNGPTQSQTGPAMRNDTQVINKQVELLEHRSHIEIYKEFTKAIKSTYGKKL